MIDNNTINLKSVPRMVHSKIFLAKYIKNHPTKLLCTCYVPFLVPQHDQPQTKDSLIQLLSIKLLNECAFFSTARYLNECTTHVIMQVMSIPSRLLMTLKDWVIFVCHGCDINSRAWLHTQWSFSQVFNHLVQHDFIKASQQGQRASQPGREDLDWRMYVCCCCCLSGLHYPKWCT